MSFYWFYFRSFLSLSLSFVVVQCWMLQTLLNPYIIFMFLISPLTHYSQSYTYNSYGWRAIVVRKIEAEAPKKRRRKTHWKMKCKSHLMPLSYSSMILNYKSLKYFAEYIKWCISVSYVASSFISQFIPYFSFLQVNSLLLLNGIVSVFKNLMCFMSEYWWGLFAKDKEDALK